MAVLLVALKNRKESKGPDLAIVNWAVACGSLESKMVVLLVGADPEPGNHVTFT